MSGTLDEGLRVRLNEAGRTLDEAEARLPRTLLAFGHDSGAGRAASTAIHELRGSFNHLRYHINQPHSGEWSRENFEAAKVALERATSQHAEFMRAASA